MRRRFPGGSWRAPVRAGATLAVAAAGVLLAIQAPAASSRVDDLNPDATTPCVGAKQSSVRLEAGIDGCLRLNQIQELGTHNSYHLEPVVKGGEAVPKGLQYSALPLPEQLDLGVRQVEFDVYTDPKGGRWTASNPGDAAMTKPGFKVFHLPVIDPRSLCDTLAGCLGQVETWSESHPTHVPLMVLIEVKDSARVRSRPGAPDPLTFDRPQFDALDRAIRAVVPRAQLLTPDDIRGGYPTLSDALDARGWPRLAQLEGRVMFVLDNPDWHREAYLDGHPGLAGRVMFTNAPPGQADSGVIEVNNPVTGAQRIHELVNDGYLVRTRADADTVEARANDHRREQAAFAGGAQWVSTDYPVADPALGTGYKVSLPGGAPARCDNMTAGLLCGRPQSS